MKKWIAVIAVLCLAAGTAMADVSNEVLVGLEGDSTSKAIDTGGTDV